METNPTKAERKRQLATTLTKLAELYPACFAADAAGPHGPLKIGIHRDMIDRGMQPSEVQALSLYVRRPAYKAALIAGGPRYDLDGNPHGEVTAEHITAAKAERIERQRTNTETSRVASIEREARSTSRLSLADLKAAARARKAAERAA